jgi:biotin carboxyl carrier protein
MDLSLFDGDPLEAAPKNIEPAKQALEERNLAVTEKNIFLVMAAMVPGKKMELNEGIRLLTGNPRIDIPLKKKEEPKPEKAPSLPAAQAPPAVTGPVTTQCTVTENNVSRTFTVTIEPLSSQDTPAKMAEPAVGAAAPSLGGTSVYSTFAGAVEVSDIKVKVGDRVKEGQVVACVEAMKAQHDILSPRAGEVSAVHVAIGDEIDSNKPILTVS